ncbi:peptidase inhibitor family I36 protein [Lentzea sp. BCCO 10_0856]|uniref:Peptidase inhibitor family I36 protein n=1 Tax=Lentzea miocenica TaxID=3095431 RepID=A0ABU4T1I4_9PSEU|nr:peptidase inhibitor family I36 protein [Lentzea sp. BCCO 10_0856]MDX8031872.1 peptidase inhibitor family I36 protein [Lentzea sp. BCCO 10_0856]
MSTKSLIAALVITAGAVASSGIAVAQSDKACDKGEFCVWTGPDYTGTVQRLDLESANPDECIPLTVVGRSFANRLSRDISAYQRENCSTEAEFTTYPKHGTYVPDAYFVIRGVQVWGP